MAKTAFGPRGFQQVDRQLSDLVRRLSTKEKRDALRAGAVPIVEEARRLAPRQTGALARSIKAVTGKRERVFGQYDLDGVSIVIGPVGSTGNGTVFYAGFVEDGTSRMTAQPYMRPAIDAMHGEAERIVIAHLAATIARKGL